MFTRQRQDSKNASRRGNGSRVKNCAKVKNWHIITSAPFYWPKQVTWLARIQGVRGLTSLLTGRGKICGRFLQSTTRGGSWSLPFSAFHPSPLLPCFSGTCNSQFSFCVSLYRWALNASPSMWGKTPSHSFQVHDPAVQGNSPI